MTNQEITASHLTSILKRNGYNSKEIGPHQISIIKSKVPVENIFLPMVMPLLAICFGGLMLVFNQGIFFLSTFFLLGGTSTIFFILISNLSNLNSKILLDIGSLIINKQKIKVEDILRFEIAELENKEFNYGQVNLVLKNKNETLEIFRLIDFNRKYLTDDLIKVLAFLNAKYRKVSPSISI